MKLNKLDYKENERIYVDKDGKETVFKNVIGFCDSLSTHRLELEDGTLIIYPKEHFKYIKIKTENFTL